MFLFDREEDSDEAADLSAYPGGVVPVRMVEHADLSSTNSVSFHQDRESKPRRSEAAFSLCGHMNKRIRSLERKIEIQSTKQPICDRQKRD